MPFLDHLEELRWHLIRSILAIVIAGGAAFLAKDFIFDVLLFGPKKQDFITYKWLCSAAQALGFDEGFCLDELPFRVQSRTVAGQFSAHIWTSITAGFIIAFPYVIYQVWKFIVAFKIFYDAIDIVESKKQDEEKDALQHWRDALSNVMPHVEVRSRRVGGATFQIPMQIRPDRKISMAMKWLISYARKRNEKSMAQKLAAEILAAEKEEGAAVKKRTDTHKMAEANKAFSHFRF